jgi:hypothetical protein
MTADRAMTSAGKRVNKRFNAQNLPRCGSQF